MLRMFVVCVSLLLGAAAAVAQDWPARSARIIVPYAAGGGTDIIARVLAQKLSIAFGQQFFVDNRSGATGMVGTQAFAKSEADGYTFLIAAAGEIALNQHLFKAVNYDPADFTPVTLLAWTPLALAAHPSLPASTPLELIGLAQARQVDYSSPGIGGVHHFTVEYINKLRGTKLVHVPYRGAGPAVSDTVGGQVKLTISGLPPVVPFLQSGALKAIAVTSKKRSPTFSSIPAMSETAGFEDFDFINWFGLLGRTGTAASILERLHKAAVDALKDPKVREILLAQAAEPVGNTPAEFREFIAGETAKYGKILEITGLKVR